MLQNPCKTLGFKKNMVYEIPPGGGGKPYPASGLSCFTKRYKLEFKCSGHTANILELYLRHRRTVTF